MTNTPRISVVTPTRNRREVLVRAIESVRAQSFQDYEHIVIDDGSTDGSEEAVRRVTDSRVRLVTLDKWGGANAARNIGIGLARAPLVTFLDSDDVFLPFRLERSVALFDSNSTIELAISAFDMPKGGAAPTASGKDVHFDSELLERAIAAQVYPIAGSAITARKTTIESIGLFDEGLWRLQDRELLLRCARNGYGAMALGTIDWIKYHSSDSISRQRGGYVTAYADLLGRHPQIRQRYPEIVAYMVARRILNLLIQGHLGEAVEEYRINRQCPELEFPVAALATGYLTGRRRRREIRHEVQSLQGKIVSVEQTASPMVPQVADSGKVADSELVSSVKGFRS